MEINITKLYAPESYFDPADISASRAELGQGAGKITWQNALTAAKEFSFINSGEEINEFKSWIKGFGAWEEEEIESWSHQERNALFLQMVAGEMREKRDDGNIFKDGGFYYYYIGF